MIAIMARRPLAISLAQHQMRRRFLLQVVVGQREAILKLLAGEYQADCLARERPHEDLHAAAQ
eukprot:10584671-Heterocapsa_arctica.AAC.1